MIRRERALMEEKILDMSHHLEHQLSAINDALKVGCRVPCCSLCHSLRSSTGCCKAKIAAAPLCPQKAISKVEGAEAVDRTHIDELEQRLGSVVSFRLARLLTHTQYTFYSSDPAGKATSTQSKATVLCSVVNS